MPGNSMKSLEDRVKFLKEKHREIYGSSERPLSAVFAPYRICPLGAHVDHQLGRVSGMTMTSGIVLVFSANKTRRVRLSSLNYSGDVKFGISDTVERAGDWSDYARGAAAALLRTHKIQLGIDAVLEGDMPVGGLSSSAAVGVAYLLAMEAANDLNISSSENIRLDAAIENNFIGLNNGVLDQSVILLSEQEKLLYLDCKSGDYETIPFGGRAENFEIVIAYSGVSKKLVDTDYNMRVHECETAAREIMRMAGIPSGAEDHLKLRHVAPEQYEERRGGLPEKLRKRADHFFSENERVVKGAEAWKSGDLAMFGELIKESCESSISNYECGCPPMISLAEIMNASDGVYGARFSGAGFRGSCIGISNPAARDSIKEKIEAEYAAREPEHASELQVHFRSSGMGARKL